MRYWLFLLGTATLMGQAVPQASTAIRQILAEQEQAWNQGNLPAFLEAYEESEEITFVGKEVTRGFAAIAHRYKNNYGNRAKMGTLTFDEIEVRMLGQDHALVLGRFQLKRGDEGGGNASGRFSLVAKRTQQGWKFIHDHTS